MSNATLYAKTTLLYLALLALISGCVKDYDVLTPPPDSEKVKIVMKVPAELEPKTLLAKYESTRCRMFVDLPTVSRMQFPGSNLQDSKFTRQGENNIYEAEVFVDGGGECEWQLDSIEFGVVYRIPNRFAKKVTAYYGGAVIVKFDGQHAPFNTVDQFIEGPDLIIVKDYYPWVREAYELGYYDKSVNLAKEYESYRTYRARDARNIFFEPVLHSDLVVTSTSPKKRFADEIVTTTFRYPDGTEESNRELEPDFKKMQKIRLKPEAK
uniref:Lipoprotein n=1 Tax=Pseudomonas graminis TaxID=158627 RepID=A0A7C1XBF3_9PSED